MNHLSVAGYARQYYYHAKYQTSNFKWMSSEMLRSHGYTDVCGFDRGSWIDPASARERYDFCLKRESKKDRRKPGKRRDSARLDKGPLHRALVICITTENRKPP
jgi:hypothetical protein